MATERYQWRLSPDILAKAVADLNEPEDNDVRLAEIDKLKKTFEEKYPGLDLIRSDDEFFLRFLRSCKFDQAYALKTLSYYHKIRKEWREVYDLVENKGSLKHIFKEGAVLSLSGRAKDGSFILIKYPGRGLRDGDSVESLVAAVFLSYEKLLENEEAQIYGFTVIIDLSHLGLRFGMKIPSLGRRFIKMLQEVLPIQVNSLNVVKESFVFDMVFTVVSQFMNNNMKQKIKLHKNNLTGLQEMIDVDTLPPSLGGTGPEEDAEGWMKEIIGQETSSSI